MTVLPRLTEGFLDAAVPLVQPRSLDRILPELAAGGVTAVLSTVASIEDARFAFGVIAEWLALERSGSAPFVVVRSTADFAHARAGDLLAVVLHFQGGDPLESDTRLLGAYHALGLRVLQLTYNFRNRLGDGCLERADSGLAKFGRQVIERANELGVVVDLAHAGVRTTLEAAKASSKPIIVSHGNAREVYESRRNLTDEQIDAVAATGGVIGLCAFPGFVGPGAPTIDTFLDHLDYIVARVGDRHVGIGLDISQETEEDYVYYGYEEDTYPRPPWTYPQGIGGFSEVGNLVGALAGRGYTEEQIERIARGNFIRVFDEVWQS